MKPQKAKTQNGKTVLSTPTRSAHFPGKNVGFVVEYVASELADEIIAGEAKPASLKRKEASTIIHKHALAKMVNERAAKIVETRANNAGRDLANAALATDENFEPVERPVAEPARAFCENCKQEQEISATGRCNFCDHKPEQTERASASIIVGEGENTITRSKHWKGAAMFDLINYIAQVQYDALVGKELDDYELEYDYEKFGEAKKIIAHYQLEQNVADRIAELKDSPESDNSETEKSLDEKIIEMTFEGKKIAEMSPREHARMNARLGDPNDPVNQIEPEEMRKISHREYEEKYLGGDTRENKQSASAEKLRPVLRIDEETIAEATIKYQADIAVAKNNTAWNDMLAGFFPGIAELGQDEIQSPEETLEILKAVYGEREQNLTAAKCAYCTQVLERGSVTAFGRLYCSVECRHTDAMQQSERGQNVEQENENRSQETKPEVLALDVLAFFHARRNEARKTLDELENNFLDNDFDNLEFIRARINLAVERVAHYTRAAELTELVMRGEV